MAEESPGVPVTDKATPREQVPGASASQGSEPPAEPASAGDGERERKRWSRLSTTVKVLVGAGAALVVAGAAVAVVLLTSGSSATPLDNESAAAFIHRVYESNGGLPNLSVTCLLNDGSHEGPNATFSCRTTAYEGESMASQLTCEVDLRPPETTSRTSLDPPDWACDNQPLPDTYIPAASSGATFVPTRVPLRLVRAALDTQKH